MRRPDESSIPVNYSTPACAVHSRLPAGISPAALRSAALGLHLHPSHRACSGHDGHISPLLGTAPVETLDGPAGAGTFVQPRGPKPPYLYHERVNARFRSMLVLAADARFGVALMTNGEGGRPLIPECLDALFDAHGQDPFRPAD